MRTEPFGGIEPTNVAAWGEPTPSANQTPCDPMGHMGPTKDPSFLLRQAGQKKQVFGLGVCVGTSWDPCAPMGASLTHHVATTSLLWSIGPHGTMGPT